MHIIPAIDLINGQCVRLTKGDYNEKTVYSNDPVEMALSFQDAGLRYLHLVDLDGAKKGEVVNWPVLEAIAKATNLIIDFSGGIKTEDQLKRALDTGAAKVTIGSLAVNRPDTFKEWIVRFGAEKLILGADVLNRQIAVHGWQENSGVDILDFIYGYTLCGMRQVMCTDVSKDGMLQGPSTALYSDILKRFPELLLIASGGVSSMEDLHALQKAGCTSTIVGKAIYEGRVTLQELSAFESSKTI